MNGKGAGMEEKKRISLHIAGRMLTIVTDESEEFVRSIESELDRKITALCRSNPRMMGKESKIDAVILCAIDSMSKEMKASREVEELKDRIAVEEKKYRELLDEYNRLSARLDAISDKQKQELTREEKIDRIEELLKARKNNPGE